MRARLPLVLALLGLPACAQPDQGLSPLETVGSTDPYAPCTDAERCCPVELRVCTGSPDRGVVCTCTSLWDCSRNPSKCEAPIPVPPGGGGSWRCSWAEDAYTCTRAGAASESPPGGGAWTCTFGAEDANWICVLGSVPNPTNGPAGVGAWRCTVVEELSKLVCKREQTTSTPLPPGGGGPLGPSADAGLPAPKPDAGTPPPKADASAPKADSGAPPPPPLPPGAVCVPGQLKWCDGEQYCGWGQVTCQGDGQWKTKLVNGKKVLDCQERSDGRRPDTKCGCYYFFFNPACCETPDCLVPIGTTGQLCAPSAGKLCNYCNPQKPECSEAGGKCVVTSAGQSVCGKACSKSSPCPTGYRCQAISSGGGFVNQCVPSSGTCPLL